MLIFPTDPTTTAGHGLAAGAGAAGARQALARAGAAERGAGRQAPARPGGAGACTIVAANRRRSKPR
jgi:hypothetical protein